MRYKLFGMVVLLITLISCEKHEILPIEKYNYDIDYQYLLGQTQEKLISASSFRTNSTIEDRYGTPLTNKAFGVINEDEKLVLAVPIIDESLKVSHILFTYEVLGEIFLRVFENEEDGYAGTGSSICHQIRLSGKSIDNTLKVAKEVTRNPEEINDGIDEDITVLVDIVIVDDLVYVCWKDGMGLSHCDVYGSGGGNGTSSGWDNTGNTSSNGGSSSGGSSSGTSNNGSTGSTTECGENPIGSVIIWEPQTPEQQAEKDLMIIDLGAEFDALLQELYPEYDPTVCRGCFDFLPQNGDEWRDLSILLWEVVKSELPF